MTYVEKLFQRKKIQYFISPVLGGDGDCIQTLELRITSSLFDHCAIVDGYIINFDVLWFNFSEISDRSYFVEMSRIWFPV